MEIEITTIDIEKVYRLIEGLADFEKDKSVETGLKNAGALFVRRGRENLKNRMKSGSNGVTGNLLRSFKVKLKRQKLGVLAGFSALGAHAHLIDRGTAIRSTNKGYNRGRIEGNDFWENAIENNKDAAIESIYTGIERAINRILKR